MINFYEAVEKAVDYLKNTDIPVVITAKDVFPKDGIFIFNLESILKQGIVLLSLQVTYRS